MKLLTLVLMTLLAAGGHAQGIFRSQTMSCSLLSGVSSRAYGIYLPSGYDEDTQRLYPVLYLMHGGVGRCTTVFFLPSSVT